jgi:deoxyribodipyrimidine photo-lyase
MILSILWFRRDLRLQDNPALHACIESGNPFLPIFILEDESHNPWGLGSASKWWLHHSLQELKQNMRGLGSDLLIFRGDPADIFSHIQSKMEISHVYWNRRYEPTAIKDDKNLKKLLENLDIEVKSFSASLLREPWEILKDNGDPYRVFTPFWKKLVKTGPAHLQHRIPDSLPPLPRNTSNLKTITLDTLKLLPDIPWDSEFAKYWQPGESGARKILKTFIQSAISHYPDTRDIPAGNGTSRLSPHLHFGEISPHIIWQQVQQSIHTRTDSGIIQAAEVYLRQLGWRDFSHHLLYHFPETSNEPLNRRFSRFPWKKNYKKNLGNWQQGCTGIPIVDAGMRELWHTGWMHNRVRMIVASLLTKNLLIPWQEGAKWFWDTLVDANLANNTMGWQWTAGCGADAAPYFRIFNPVRQGERFDPHGDYVRSWISELKLLPDKWIHQPWEAPSRVLEQAQVTLGKTYPKPIVDLSESRKTALAIWNELKTK